MPALKQTYDNPEQYKKLFSLEDRVAIVTGGAGHLGSSISKGLAAAGAQVALIGRTEKKLVNFMKKYQANFGNRFEYYVCDITNEEEFETIVKHITKEHGRINILVNNAAAVKEKRNFEELTKKQLEQKIKMNLVQYATCAQKVLPIMIKQGGGNIINIASLYGFLGVDQRMYLDLGNNSPIHYTMCKAGVIGMTKWLATNYATKGIRANSISPGIFPPMKLGVAERPDYIEEICKRTPMHRIGQPDEISGATVFLSSDASSFVTGQNIVVDGGYSVW